MKNNTVKLISALLALMMLALCFVACGSTTGPSENSGTPSASTTGGADSSTPPETTQRLDDYGRPYLEADIPDNLNYNNDEFVVHMRGNVEKYEWYAEDESGDTLNDAIFKRNARVEDQCKIKLTVIAEGSWADYDKTTLPKLKDSISAGDQAYDLLAGYGNATSLATQGLLLDLNTLEYIDFDKPWWSKNFKDEMTVNGKTYFGIGSLSLSMIYSMDCIFVNTDLLADTASEQYNIYQVVKDGKWTFDEMALRAKSAWVDRNGNGIVDADDTVGFTSTDKSNSAIGFFYATGRKITKRDAEKNPTFDELDVNSISTALDAVIKVLYQSEGVLTDNTDSSIHFYDGQTLFNFRWLYWGQTQYAGLMDHYGIVPMPKMNEDQANYVTPVQAGMHIYCIPRDVADPTRDAIVTEAFAAESYRSLMPAYFEVVLKAKYAKDAQTSQMLDLMYETVDFDIGYIWRSDLPFWSSIQDIITYKNNSFSMQYKTIAKQSKTAMQKLISALS